MNNGWNFHSFEDVQKPYQKSREQRENGDRRKETGGRRPEEGE
jgi:hypothetical protein